jgi:hypothetical protein
MKKYDFAYSDSDYRYPDYDFAHSWLRLVAAAVSNVGKTFQSLSARELVALCDERDIEIPLEDCDDCLEGADPRALWVGRILARLFREDSVLTLDGVRITRVFTPIEYDGRKVTLKTYVFAPLAELADKGSSTVNALDLVGD